MQSPTPLAATTFQIQQRGPRTTMAMGRGGGGDRDEGGRHKGGECRKKRNFFLAFVEQETKSKWKEWKEREEEGKKRRRAKLDE